MKNPVWTILTVWWITNSSLIIIIRIIINIIIILNKMFLDIKKAVRKVISDFMSLISNPQHIFSSLM